MLLKTIPGGFKEEKEVHRRFQHQRFPRTEQFKPGPDLMELIGKPLLVSVNPETVEAISGHNQSGKAMTNLKCSREWKAWVDGLALYCRTDIAKLIDRGLILVAKAEGYEKEVPTR